VSEPLPDPGPAAELPEAALPAPAPTSVAESTPGLRGTGIVPEKQTARRVAGVEALTPRAGKEAAASRIALTTAEQAAVARGLQELERTGVVEAPRRPASTRSSLTAEEKAAVERGLQELQKAAGPARP
jgi:hypothetical protein